MNWKVCAFSLAVVFVAGLVIGSKTAQKSRIIEERVKIDTLIVRDTITQNRAVSVEVLKIRMDTCYLQSIDTVCDTVSVEVPISYEKAAYQDANVWYHGYCAGVDSIQVFPETKIITKDVTKIQKASRFGVGVSVGYGVTSKGCAPYVGIGLTYDILRF